MSAEDNRTLDAIKRSNEYEWLHAVSIDGETMTLYRHNPSNKPVIVCHKSGNPYASTTWLPRSIVNIIKEKF